MALRKRGTPQKQLVEIESRISAQEEKLARSEVEVAELENANVGVAARIVSGELGDGDGEAQLAELRVRRRALEDAAGDTRLVLTGLLERRAELEIDVRRADHSEVVGEVEKASEAANQLAERFGAALGSAIEAAGALEAARDALGAANVRRAELALSLPDADLPEPSLTDESVWSFPQDRVERLAKLVEAGPRTPLQDERAAAEERERQRPRTIRWHADRVRGAIDPEHLELVRSGIPDDLVDEIDELVEKERRDRERSRAAA